MKSRISALSKAGGIASEDKAGDLRGRKVWSKSPGYPGGGGGGAEGPDPAPPPTLGTVCSFPALTLPVYVLETNVVLPFAD